MTDHPSCIAFFLAVAPAVDRAVKATRSLAFSLTTRSSGRTDTEIDDPRSWLETLHFKEFRKQF
jgi:hypothetical protein